MEYSKKELHPHILLRPDTYIGSVVPETREEYIVTDGSVVHKEITIIPALERLFVEAMSNAIDNKWRSEQHNTPCSMIRVTIDEETGLTTVWNDGLSIPIKKNEESVWIPQMIFGELLSGSNFNDTEARYTSGRNGIGIKAVNIFSKQFSVECVDPERGLIYKQTWKDNMYSVGKPSVRKKSNATGYTKVSWVPDFAYFKQNGYSTDLIGVLTRHVYDTAMITGLKLYLNKQKIPIRQFKDYPKLFMSEDDATKECLVIETPSLSLAIIPSHDGFRHRGYVNGIHTLLGGTHIDATVNMVFKPLLEEVRKKRGISSKLSLRDLKSHFMVFVNCLAPNPTFATQSKEKMTAPKLSIKLDAKEWSPLLRWSFIDRLKEQASVDEVGILQQSERTRGYTVIPGYDRANKAGTKYSDKCSLILCEGLSAKTYAMTGIQNGINFGGEVGELKGRDWFGIMPLRGKLLNVRNASKTSIANNREITNLIQALGLKYGVDYSKDTHFKTLRYGRVVLLCDSDVDGIHIESLVLNVFHYLFPSIMKRDGVFFRMMTPVMKIIYKNKPFRFYTMEDAKKFMNGKSNSSMTVKYYKGLGTSNDKDIKETFGKKVVIYDETIQATPAMNLAFDKKFAGERKEWLRVPVTPVEFNQVSSTICSKTLSDFLTKELVLFSMDDCLRNLPSLYDGLKESQRKILYACFLKNMTEKTSVKVAQLSGFVAEKTDYHHGEQCLQDTIIRMAQDYVGSNNLPLLLKDGQVGTRLANGQDAASARYVFVRLGKHTRTLFSKLDDEILEYREEEGNKIEPYAYIPVIPMLLVNGSEGIGTGWSCSVPSYNPVDLINWINEWLTTGKSNVKLIPWYNGFKGTIVQESKHKFCTFGVLDRQPKKVVITELPIGTSIEKFKEFCETLMLDKKLKSFRNNSTPDNIHFELVENSSGFKCSVDTLNLKSHISTTNLVVLGDKNVITKHSTVENMLEEYCSKRIELYSAQKTHMVTKLQDVRDLVFYRLKFLQDVMGKKILLFKNPEDKIVAKLEKDGYPLREGKYNYLLDMPVRQFTKQKLTQLMTQLENTDKDIKYWSSVSEKKLWMNDLANIGIEDE